MASAPPHLAVIDCLIAAKGQATPSNTGQPRRRSENVRRQLQRRRHAVINDMNSVGRSHKTNGFGHVAREIELLDILIKAPSTTLFIASAASFQSHDPMHGSSARSSQQKDSSCTWATSWRIAKHVSLRRHGGAGRKHGRSCVEAPPFSVQGYSTLHVNLPRNGSKAQQGTRATFVSAPMMHRQGDILVP